MEKSAQFNAHVFSGVSSPLFAFPTPIVLKCFLLFLYEIQISMRSASSVLDIQTLVIHDLFEPQEARIAVFRNLKDIKTCDMDVMQLNFLILSPGAFLTFPELNSSSSKVKVLSSCLCGAGESAVEMHLQAFRDLPGYSGWPGPFCMLECFGCFFQC